MSTGMIILIIVIVVIVGIILWIIGAMNKMMREEQNVFTEYNNAKLVVERRFKNIESTVNLMKSHNAAISEAFEKIVQARNQNSGPEQTGPEVEKYAKLDQQMQEMVKNINVTVERYPELGKMFDANEFSKQMAQHDRDVEMSKKLYNHEVEQFNTLIMTIPYNFFAGGKRNHQYWEVKEFDTKDDYIPEF